MFSYYIIDSKSIYGGCVTTLTIRFSGLQEQVLDRLVESGVAGSKSEAIRMALLKFANDVKLLDDEVIVSFLRRELSKAPRSPEEILRELERAKHETVSR